MTDINPAAAAARETARTTTGQFGTQGHSAPETELNPRAELDAVNSLYHDNADRIREEVALYLQFGMPEAAHRVEFENSDQGDYVYAARAFDADGQPIDTEDDYDRWASVDDVVSNLGYPDDNRQTFAELFKTEDGGVYTWTRTDDTNEADELAIRERIDALIAVRRELGSGSQAAAITTVRRLLPEGSRLVLTWGDQGGPDYLSAEKLILADGTELDGEEAFDEGIDWDEIDMAASDIRDVDDVRLRHLDDREMHFELAQNPATSTSSGGVDPVRLAEELRKQAKATLASEAGA